jgi:pyridoxamine 5'-phosphate oxidase
VTDPFDRFAEWFEQARVHPAVGLHEAMSLATVTRARRPSSRIVLLKDHGPAGFVFYTNLGSRKAGELSACSAAALLFWWEVLDHQIRIEGRVEAVSESEADAYFATRPRVSQIGAWASRQSEEFSRREDLEARVIDYEREFADREVPRPEFWSGLRLVPDRFEFWSRGAARLHHREVFVREGTGWRTSLLQP